MQKINKTNILSVLLAIVCFVQASTSSSISSATTPSPSDDLKCYICENCAKITKETPLEECDAEFFEKRSSTTQDPEDDSTATNTTPFTTTTTEMATTTTTTEQTSTELNTETTTTTTFGTTTEAIPTAPTVGPLNTTTMLTPPTEGIVPTSSVFVVAKINGTTNTTVDAPKALSLVAEDYSYHCYSVQKKVNGSMLMERGCSRTSAMESVCGQLKALNMGVPLSKCVPCSNSECNGSSALGVSVAALMFALTAALLSRQ